MTHSKNYTVRRLGIDAMRIAVAAAVTLPLAACRPGDEPDSHIAGWALIDPAQRHPIIVSQQPANLTLRVSRGSAGLTPQQRASVIDFVSRYRGGDSRSGRLSIGVPSGSPNEVAAMHAVADLRDLVRDYGVDETQITIHPYPASGDGGAPIRVSYSRFVAQGPTCSQWPTNLGEDSRNLPAPDLGCSNQRNLAAQIANPADLVAPRTMTARPGERRDQNWEKWIKGESTVSEKKSDEKAQVKGAD